MKRALLALAAILAVSLPITPAHATAPSDTDIGCEAVILPPNGEHLVVIHGGPILQTGTITCTIQVGGATHADPNNGVTVSGARFGGVSFLSPTVQSFWAPSLTPIYLCAQFTDTSGTTYFFDDVTSLWTTSSASACRLSISGGLDDPVFDPLWDLQDTAWSLLCSALAVVRGVPGVVEITPEGDVYVFGSRVLTCR